MRITIRTTPLLRQTRFYAAAFSLLELLVVISIIAVLMTIGSYGIKNFSKASGVSAAIPIAQGVFSQARSLAIEKGTDTRVLIQTDNDAVNMLNRERNLRYMLVQYLDTKETEVTTDDEWLAASKGVYLPEGVYYSIDLSNLSNAPDVTVVTTSMPGLASDTVACRNYEFNSQGIITSPPPTNGTAYGNDVPRFVVRAGNLPPGRLKAIAASGAGESNASGFVIWKNGRTAVFRHPDQIASSAVFSDKTKF